MTLKQIMTDIEDLENAHINVPYREQKLCLVDMVYAIAAASKNLTALEVVNICKDVMKEYSTPEEEE